MVYLCNCKQWLLFCVIVLLCESLLVDVAVAQCSVTQNPRTTVGLVNTTVTFICHDDDTDNIFPILLEINSTIVRTQHKDQYSNNGISWDSIYDSNDVEIGFNVSIVATKSNNGVSVQCFFDPCIGTKVYLIVVDSTPNPLTPPIIEATDYNSLSISWYPPWTHPVNYYVLHVWSAVTNETNETTTTQLTLTLSRQSYNYSTCEELHFTVVASTDVGLSTASNATKYGFIRGIESVSNLSSSYNVTIDSNGLIELHIAMYWKSLGLCDYETLRYHFSVVNQRSMDTVIISNEPQTMNNLADMVVIPINFTVNHNDSLTVNLTLIDDTGYTLEYTLIENIIIDLYVETTMLTAVAPSASRYFQQSAGNMATPVLTQSPNSGSSTVVISTSVTSGALFVVLIIACSVITC